MNDPKKPVSQGRTDPLQDPASSFQLTPAKDEIASRQRKASNNRASGSAKTTKSTSPTSNPTPRQNAPIAGNSGLTSILAFVCVVLVALCGWLFYDTNRLHSQLAQSNSTLDAIEQQVAALESEFTSSGESQNLSVQAMQVKLKNNSSEIRKLWGVSYDRNKKG